MSLNWPSVLEKLLREIVVHSLSFLYKQLQGEMALTQKPERLSTVAKRIYSLFIVFCIKN
uniref:Uncharacterized protein n=1 Tax=uncultured Desulfobacterales bacterium HF0200_07G10 TaxID=710741 RepID=E0XU62_9BACT|nr:hypothetical protein [uncultured Desulfobacterales bacterium HF0200_07G10]